jgi:hypothetical protein
MRSEVIRWSVLDEESAVDKSFLDEEPARKTEI